MTNKEIIKELQAKLFNLQTQKESINTLKKSIESIPTMTIIANSNNIDSLKKAIEFAENKFAEISEMSKTISLDIKNLVGKDAELNAYNTVIANEQDVLKLKGFKDVNSLESFKKAKEICYDEVEDLRFNLVNNLDNDIYDVDTTKLTYYCELVNNLDEEVKKAPKAAKVRKVKDSKKDNKQLSKNAKKWLIGIGAIALVGILATIGSKLSKDNKSLTNKDTLDVLNNTPAPIEMPTPTATPKSIEVEVEETIDPIDYAFAEEELCEKLGKELYIKITANNNKTHYFGYSEEETIDYVKRYRESFNSLPSTADLDDDAKREVFVTYLNDMVDFYVESMNVRFDAVIANMFDGKNYSFENPEFYKVFENDKVISSNEKIEFKGVETLKLFEDLGTKLFNATTNDNDDEFKAIATEYIELCATIFPETSNILNYNGKSIKLTNFNSMHPCVAEAVISEATLTLGAITINYSDLYASNPCYTAKWLFDEIRSTKECNENNTEEFYWDTLSSKMVSLIAAQEKIEKAKTLTLK